MMSTNNNSKSSVSFRETIVVSRIPAAMFAVVLGLCITSPGFGQTAKQGASVGVQYVSAQGSDSHDGLSWRTAKNTIAAAVRSCPALGLCTVNVSSLRLSSALSLNRPDTTIRCAGGATISTAVMNGAPITVKANGFQITGCTFEYSSGVANTVVAVPRSVSHVTIDHNVFRNYTGRPSYAGIIHIGNRTNRSAATAVTDVHITDNRFLNVDPDAINIQDEVFRVTISNNIIVTDISVSRSPTINAQTSDPGTALETIVVSNNSISKGTSNDCIQIQNLAFDNTTIQNVTVSGNTCRLQPHAGAGAGATGYSMAGIADLVETGNAFEGYGQTITGNAPFELFTCQRATSSHNLAELGIVTTNTNAFTVIGTPHAVTRDVSLMENYVFMKVHGSARSSCFHINTTGVARIEQLTVTGNSCDLSGSSTTGTLRGIWIQSNSRGAVIQDGTLSGNVITGATGAEVLGIHLEQDAGTISGWRVGQNRFRNTRRDVVGGEGSRR